MHSAIIDRATLRDLSRIWPLPQTSNYRDLTAQTDLLRTEVEEHWADLPEEKRRLLYALSHRLLLESRPTWLAFLDRILDLVSRIVPTSDEEFSEFCRSLVSLARSTLNAAEREHPEYAAVVSAAIRDGLDSGRVSDPMTIEEFKERLAKKIPAQRRR